MDENTETRAGAAALQHFKDGLYCAESVLVALARRQGIDSPDLPAIATGFCSGLGQTAGPCGAYTGAVMGLGLAFGRDSERESVEQAYAAVKTLTQRFATEFGSTNCAELLGCDLGTPEGRQAFDEGKLYRRCMTYTERAADLAAELIDAAMPAAACAPVRSCCAGGD